MKKFIVLIFILIPTISYAQQQSKNDASSRIASQLGFLLIQIEQQTDTISNLQMQSAQLQAEIKRLKDKYEPTAEKKE